MARLILPSIFDKNYDPTVFNFQEQSELLEKIAHEKYDGHLTIMRFTTHWKCFFGTLDLRSGRDVDWLSAIPGYETIQEAMEQLEIDQRREQKDNPSFWVSAVPRSGNSPFC